MQINGSNQGMDAAVRSAEAMKDILQTATGMTQKLNQKMVGMAAEQKVAQGGAEGSRVDFKA